MSRLNCFLLVVVVSFSLSLGGCKTIELASGTKLQLLGGAVVKKKPFYFSTGDSSNVRERNRWAWLVFQWHNLLKGMYDRWYAGKVRRFYSNSRLDPCRWLFRGRGESYYRMKMCAFAFRGYAYNLFKDGMLKAMPERSWVMFLALRRQLFWREVQLVCKNGSLGIPRRIWYSHLSRCAKAKKLKLSR